MDLNTITHTITVSYHPTPSHHHIITSASHHHSPPHTDGFILKKDAKRFLQDLCGHFACAYDDPKATRVLGELPEYQKNGKIEYFELQRVLFPNMGDVMVPSSLLPQTPTAIPCLLFFF